METDKWTPEKEVLEEENNFLNDVIPGLGIAYRSLLTAYDNPVGTLGYRDRGYNEAKQVLELLSVVSDKDHRSSAGLSVEEEESGYFHRLVRLTSALVPYLPAMSKELVILGRLRESYLEPMRKIIYETVPERMGELGGRLVFSPQEFIDLAEATSAIMAYFDYRKGRSYLNFGHFVDGVSVDDLVKRFVPSLGAFGFKWRYGAHWNLSPGGGGVDQFGFINLAMIDSLDGSTIAKSLESDNPGEVISSYVPEKGIEEALFNEEARSALRTGMENDLLAGTQRDTMCTASMIRRRGNEGEFLKYLRRVKKALRMHEPSDRMVA